MVTVEVYQKVSKAEAQRQFPKQDVVRVKRNGTKTLVDLKERR